jgi:hypothetical protein
LLKSQSASRLASPLWSAWHSSWIERRSTVQACSASSVRATLISIRTPLPALSIGSMLP